LATRRRSTTLTAFGIFHLSSGTGLAGNSFNSTAYSAEDLLGEFELLDIDDRLVNVFDDDAADWSSIGLGNSSTALGMCR
jgi:hypothetical protein